ncbi:MEDS domain-containing protein [Dactylosporangium sp. NPDC000244]|uniref:MEDS domain-containing protein n=1 Tax=Dactylosporangium sp. NPDC000244 TaxID=3154365 RepID=UPI00332173C7
MRRTGFVDAVDALGGHDHVSWVFDDPADYHTVVDRFLADGRVAGQRVLSLLREEADGPIDPAEQLRFWADATERALADGYTGLRVAADSTRLVATPEGRAAFGRYEFMIDAYMARHPLSGLCGFNRAELGDAAVAELAGMHPLAQPAATPLRLFATAEPGVAAVLAGEIDPAGHEQLRAALRRIELDPVGGAVTIDARELTFIDHRALMQLVGHVRGLGAATVLRVGRHSAVPRLADLLQLRDLRAVVS